jgi:hypothetical protein
VLRFSIAFYFCHVSTSAVTLNQPGSHQQSTNTLTPPAFAPDPGSAYPQLIRVPLVRSWPLPYHYQKVKAALEETPHAMREPQSRHLFDACYLLAPIQTVQKIPTCLSGKFGMPQQR